MKRILITIALLLGLSVVAVARSPVPLDDNGRPIPANREGCLITRVFSASTPVLVSGAAGEGILIDWIMISSAAAGGYMIVYDTSSVLATSPTDAGVLALMSAKVQTYTADLNPIIRFDPPMRSVSGFALILGLPALNQGGVACYRKVGLAH